MCGCCLRKEHKVAFGEISDSVEDGRFGAVKACGAQYVDDGWSQERAVEVVCLAGHDCAIVARDLGVDIFTAVSWRGVRVSGVLKGCSDGVVVATHLCTSESRRAWMHVNIEGCGGWPAFEM